jgi:hypothetical protein
MGPQPSELLKPYPAELMTMWPVSQKPNSPKNDGPELLEPVLADRARLKRRYQQAARRPRYGKGRRSGPYRRSATAGSSTPAKPSSIDVTLWRADGGLK